MAKKSKKPVPPATKAEAMDEAVKNIGYGKFQPESFEPALRMFCPGDKLDYGNLEDVTVEQVRDERRIVVFSFKSHSNSGHSVDGRSYMAAPWFLCYPAQAEFKNKNVKRRRAWDSWINTGLGSLIKQATCNEIRDNPDYQRGYVWTLEDKQRFVRSAMDGLDLGKFVLIGFPWPDNKHEVVDGKQRLSALRDFCFSKFPVIVNGQPVFWHQFTRMDRYEFESRMVQYVLIDGSRTSKADILRLFLELNVAGVPQKEEHLAHVRGLLAAEIEKGPKTDED